MNSQTWAKKEAKIRRKNEKYSPPSSPQLATPISYVRLEHLQTVARNEHMEGPDSKLPIEVKDELTEEWLTMVDEAFNRFNKQLKCQSCGKNHDDEGMPAVLSGLKKEMEAADVEEIDEDVVEGFQAQFETIWKVYLEENNGSACDEDEEEGRE